MPLPTHKVELAFGASGYIDVTEYVQSVSINRGISRVLDDFSAGSCSVTFVNNNRVFDPTNGNTNLVTNYSFETDASGWLSNTSTIARSTTIAYAGLASLKHTSTAPYTSYEAYTPTQMPVVANKDYSVAVFVRTEVVSTSMVLKINWYDSANNIISTPASSAININSTSWTRATFTSTSPANAVAAQIIFTVTNVGGVAQSVFYDLVSFAQSNPVGSPLYGIVQPAGQIRISSNGVVRFTGFVQDWDFSFGESGLDGQATVTALDLIYDVGQVEFADDPGQYFDINYGIQQVVETTGDRIDRVFKNNGFDTTTYALVESGKTIVGADVNNAGDSVLSYMQNLARSEPADFFSNASAVMVMKDRSFTNYTWANTTRNNLIVYPGTATAITIDEEFDIAGWLYGGQEYTTTPLLSEVTNVATIDSNLFRYRMQYSDLNKQKYNPDGTATDFTFSAYFRGPGLVTGGGIFGDLELLDEYAQVLVTTPLTATAANALDWVQLTVSNNYAGTGVVAGISVSLSAASTTPSYLFIANGWMFERASSYTNYFDGTTNPLISSAATAYSVGWSGEPYKSYSGLVTSVASTASAPAVRSFADSNSQSTFSGTAIPFTDLQVVYASEQLYNNVQVIGINATAIVQDTVSQGLYGLRTYVQTDNLTTSVTKPDEIASGFLGEFRLPEYRAEQLTVALESLTTAQQTIVLGIEIRDIVRVAFKPSNTGSSVDKYYQVLGISSNSDLERDAVTFNLASLDNLSFRLDSTFLGILDTDTLA
jgi:hypothetical protein